LKDIYKISKIKKFFYVLKGENYNSSRAADIKKKFYSSIKTLIGNISKQIMVILKIVNKIKK
jgi:hypothetical protein